MVGGQLWGQRLIALLGLLALILVFSLLTCSKNIKIVPTTGGTLVEGIVGTPFSPNPLFVESNGPDQDLATLIFSGLIRPGWQGEPQPDLAERWAVSPDGRTYTFHLRPHVRWHDGERVTARDVLFTFGLVQDPSFPGSPLLSSLFRGIRVEAVDDLTARFSLGEPFSPFLSYVSIGLLPSHILQGIPARDILAGTFRSLLVGTGPFRIKEAYIDRVVLEANPSYHLGRPYLSQVILRFFPEYREALQALKNREVNALASLAPSDALELARSDDWRVVGANRTNMSVIFLNIRSPLLRYKAVRQALTYSLDRAQILRVAALGEGWPAESLLPAGTWVYTATSIKYAPDPERARQLLEADGWRMGADGMWERTEVGSGKSIRLRFSLLTNDDSVRVRVAREVAQQWRSLGVGVDVSVSGSTGLIRDFLVRGQFDAVLYGIDLGIDPDLYNVLHSSQARNGGMNFGGYASREVDWLLEEARRTPDREQRRDIYRRLGEILQDDVPIVPLYQPKFNLALDKEIKGVRLGPIDRPSSRYLRVNEWYIRTRMTFVP